MEAKDFDKIVKARANKRVQKKLTSCQKVAYEAICELVRGYKDTGSQHERNNWGSDIKAILLVLASDNNDSGWPSELWEREETLVANQLLSTMDEMQEALIAASEEPNPNDCTPAEKATEQV